MYANTIMNSITDYTRPYSYVLINSQCIYNEFEMDPLTNKEIYDIRCSLEDLRAGRYTSFSDKTKLMSYLDKL